MKFEIFTKAMVCTAIAFAGLNARASELPVAQYGIASWETKGHGNHRAVLELKQAAPVVKGTIPWRRRDANPEQKAILLFNENGERVTNLKVLSLTGDQGELLFEAAAPGRYYAYYLPYNPGVSNFDDPGTYFTPKETASTEWLNRAQAVSAPPVAQLVEIQANGEFHRFDPMEVMPTKAEVAGLAKKAGDKEFLLFPEDRRNSIRMLDGVPFKWVASGPSQTFTGEVQPNEWYPWQIGVWAPEKELKNLKVEISDFKNAAGEVIKKSALTCFNTGGVDARGKDFTAAPSVPKGAVQPLWLMAEIPAKASGEYQGTVTITPENAPAQTVAVTLKVKGEPLADHGVADLWRLSRLRWLNSRIGLEDTIVPPMKPMKRTGNQVELTCTGVEFGPDGLPAQITAGGRKSLTAPVALKFLTAEGNELKFKQETSLTRDSEALQERRTSATGEALSYTLASQLDYTGGINYELTVKADKPVALRDMRLEIPVAKEAASYLMGFGQRGGLRGGAVDWKWSEDLWNYLWLGDATGGLQLKLTGATDNWDGASLKPIGIPEGWYNDKKGGGFVKEQDGTVMLCAYTGERTLEAGQELTFKFRLLLTPSKPIEADRSHWQNHYGGSTSNRIHVHHMDMNFNPYINYPFFKTKELKNLREAAVRTDATLKGKMEYLIPKPFDPTQGSVEAQVKVAFDPAKTKPGDASGNQSLLAMEYPNGDFLGVYWNVDVKGLRSLYKRGDGQPAGFIDFPTPDWKEGQIHQVGLSWTKNSYALWVDGSLIAECPIPDGPWHEGADPVRIALDSAGFAYGPLRVRNGVLTAELAKNPKLKDPATILLETPATAGSQVRIDGEVTQADGFTANARKMKTIKSEIDLYYTVRELTNWAAELWALRSLGTEIFRRDTTLVYSVEKTEMAATGGGDPWLREHLVDNYVPAWRQPLADGATDASIATTGLSRLQNHYLEGLDWLMKETGVNGLYLDGIGYDEQIMARVAKLMLANTPDYRIKFHAGNQYDFLNLKINTLGFTMAHFPYITELWTGELFDYNRPPDYWLTEISGIPFGLYSEMLNYQDGGNPYRGMVYGMSSRHNNTCTAIYQLWDDFGIADAKPLGYWDPRCPVATDAPDVRASAYVKEGKSLIAIAGWDPDYMLAQHSEASMEPSADATITIDGVMKPEEWGKAAQLTNFKGFDTKAKVPSAGQTVAYLTFDSTTLYFAFRSIGPTGNLVAKHEGRDSMVWEDDSVEFFLQPNPAGGDHYQIVVNSKGVLFDTKGMNGGFWNGPWTVATAVAPDSWTCEGSIPLAAFGLTAEQMQEGRTVGVNFVRNQKTPAAKISTWSPSSGMLHQQENFGRIAVAKSEKRMLQEAVDAIFGNRTVEEIKPDTVEQPLKVKLSFDWKALGLDPAKVKMTAPKLVNFQQGQVFDPATTEFDIPKDRGLILLLEGQ
jgi:hypothetical protein